MLGPTSNSCAAQLTCSSFEKTFLSIWAAQVDPKFESDLKSEKASKEKKFAWLLNCICWNVKPLDVGQWLNLKPFRGKIILVLILWRISTLRQNMELTLMAKYWKVSEWMSYDGCRGDCSQREVRGGEVDLTVAWNQRICCCKLWN